jgi:sec-independent protein translocase protein TatC
VGHEDTLSIVEHLDELRTRIILCIVAFVVVFGLTYWQNDRILDVVNRPLDRSQRVDCDKPNKADDALERSSCFDVAVGAYVRQSGAALTEAAEALRALATTPGTSAAARLQTQEAVRALRASTAAASDAAALTPKRASGRQPVTLGVTEPFLTTITVAAYAALLITMPFLLWQAYAFVLPAFTQRERRVALPLMMMVPVLFIGGVVFGYFLALPRAVDFLQNYNDAQFDILVQAKDYYRFSVVLLAAMGLMFQIPVGVLAVVRLGVVTTRQLRSYRGYALIGFAVIAAVVTPTPDPFTMLIALAPLVVLYELSIILARVFEPKRSRWALFDDEDDDDLADAEHDDLLVGHRHGRDPDDLD